MRDIDLQRRPRMAEGKVHVEILYCVV